MKTTVYSIIMSLGIFFCSWSQSTVAVRKGTYDKISFGLGLGMDYGGIGGNVIGYVHKNVGLFGGLGYNLENVGYNVGLKLRWTRPDYPAKITPYVMGMYGYNTVIKVEDHSQFDKVFYGASVGAGLDFRWFSGTRGFWSVALLVPIRGSDVSNYQDDLEQNYGVDFGKSVYPVAGSIGYHFVVD